MSRRDLLKAMLFTSMAGVRGPKVWADALQPPRLSVGETVRRLAEAILAGFRRAGYVVGEHGPERIVPAVPGYVYPSVGGDTYHIQLLDRVSTRSSRDIVAGLIRSRNSRSLFRGDK